MPLVQCPRCGRVNPSVAVNCLHCGALTGRSAPAEGLTDLQRLEGTWAMRSFSLNGAPLPPEEVRKYRVTIRGGRYVLDYAGQRVVFGLRLDPTRRPKEVDWTDAAGNTLLGIYQFDGGVLRVCRAAAYGQPRPALFFDFDAALAEWERVDGAAPGGA